MFALQPYLIDVFGGASSVGAPLSLVISNSTALDQVVYSGTNIGANGSGWSAVVKIKGLTSLTGVVDATALTVYVSDPGYDTLGNATTVTRTINGVAHMRRQYPNGGSKQISTDGADLYIVVTLDDWIYVGTTIVSAQITSTFYPSALAGSMIRVVNSSVTPYPRPLFGWVNLQQDTCGSTYAVEAVSAHRHARNQSQIACIKFSGTDGTSTSPVVTTSITAISAIIKQGQPLEVFKATVDMSTLTQGVMCRINAVVYPWIGDASTVLDLSSSGVAWPTSLPDTQLRVLCDRTGGYGGAYAYVKVGATGGTVSATPATAAASPFPTVQTAMDAIPAWNLTNKSHGDMGGSFIRLMDASGADVIHAMGVTPSGSAGLTFCTVERDSAATGSVSITWTAQCSFPDMMRWRNLKVGGSVTATFTAAPIAGATSGTMTATWAGATGVFGMTFLESSGGVKEFRVVTLTNGSTTVTWSVALAAACSATTGNIGYFWLGPNTNRCMVCYDGCTIDNTTNRTVSGWYSLVYLYNLTLAGTNTLNFLNLRPTTANIAIMAGVVSNSAPANPYGGVLARLTLGNYLPEFQMYADTNTYTDGDDGSLFINNRVMCAMVVSGTAARTLVKGFASIQNVHERWHIQAASGSYFEDGDLSSVANFIEMHNTSVGERASHMYNDALATKVGPSGIQKSGVAKFNIWDNYNIKSDTFSSGPQGAGAGSVGNWSFMYSVGNSGNVSLFGAVGRNVTDLPHNDNNDSPYMGMAWLPSSEYNLTRPGIGFTQTQIIAAFTNYTVLPNTTISSGGNYLPIAGTVGNYFKNRVPSGMAVLRFDIAGIARRNDGTGAAGAYEFS